MPKTTAADFDLFKRECEYWIEWFGINSWHVSYEHKNINDTQALLDYDTMNRSAEIVLATKLPTNVHNDEYIKRTAFHEVAELLTCRLSTIAGWIGNKDFVLDRQHEIIHILENSVYKKNPSGIKK